MSSCLGLYIQKHLIKYAKISKQKDNIKVESFGIKFFDKKREAISKVIEETYSQKTKISINTSEEMYNSFDKFLVNTKKNLKEEIEKEFETFFINKGYNSNEFETRHVVADSTTDNENKSKIINISNNKKELNETIQELDGYNLENISPISMSIANLIQVKKDENILIVNMEDNTVITTIFDGKIFNIDIIKDGSNKILSKINQKENSYSKSYEICKNTTIYISKEIELQEEQNYLEDIMPSLNNVIGKIYEIISNYTNKIEKIYITGTAALINNIDLYFEKKLSGIKCELLKPYFIENEKETSIKDYIEVNSAISMALMGLGEGVRGMNFIKKTLTDQISSCMPRSLKKFFVWDLGEKFDKTEKNLVRVAVALFLLVVFYSGFSGLLSYQMNEKIKEVDDSIAQANSQIELANNDNEQIKTKANEYTTMIQNLQNVNNRLTDKNETENDIPNLLNQIMSIIPENVQLTSIENDTKKHIVINAKSDKYEQLGFFVASLKSDVILTNIVSATGQKDNSAVTIKIEGDLP